MKIGDTMTLTIEARLTYDGNAGSVMHMRFADCVATVSEGGEKIGEISGCLGGGTELKDEASGATWYLSPEALWTAFCDARVLHNAEREAGR